jgi:hypothetical protein
VNKIRECRMVMLSTPFQRMDWVWEMFCSKERMNERFGKGTVCTGKIVKRSVSHIQRDSGKEDTEQNCRTSGWKMDIQIRLKKRKECTV